MTETNVSVQITTETNIVTTKEDSDEWTLVQIILSLLSVTLILTAKLYHQATLQIFLFSLGIIIGLFVGCSCTIDAHRSKSLVAFYWVIIWLLGIFLNLSNFLRQLSQ